MHSIKLSKKKEYRTRMLRNLATSLVLYESIKTTKSKYKALRPLISRLLKVSLNKNLTNYRLAKSILFTKSAVKKLFEDVGQRLIVKNGQYFQSFSLPNRQGDNSPRVLIKINLKPLEEVIKEEEKALKREQKTKKKSDRLVTVSVRNKAGVDEPSEKQT